MKVILLINNSYLILFIFYFFFNLDEKIVWKDMHKTLTKISIISKLLFYYLKSTKGESEVIKNLEYKDFDANLKFFAKEVNKGMTNIIYPISDEELEKIYKFSKRYLNKEHILYNSKDNPKDSLIKEIRFCCNSIRKRSNNNIDICPNYFLNNVKEINISQIENSNNQNQLSVSPKVQNNNNSFNTSFSSNQPNQYQTPLHHSFTIINHLLICVRDMKTQNQSLVQKNLEILTSGLLELQKSLLNTNFSPIPQLITQPFQQTLQPYQPFPQHSLSNFNLEDLQNMIKEFVNKKIDSNSNNN